jgi:hypothetical protein
LTNPAFRQSPIESQANAKRQSNGNRSLQWILPWKATANARLEIPGRQDHRLQGEMGANHTSGRLANED